METTALLPATRMESVSNKRVWAGRIVSGLAVAFLVMDGVMKLAPPAPVLEAFGQLGFPAGVARGIGLLLLACVACYVNPRTSVLGAVLLTGYLGGAVASHVRVESPLVSHTLFPVYVGAMIWGGLFLRDERVRALIAPRK
ncbi:membrane protein [Minicystis rosea]|nr:membrane protein [Minicystis rosea]